MALLELVAAAARAGIVPPGAGESLSVVLVDEINRGKRRCPEGHKRTPGPVRDPARQCPTVPLSKHAEAVDSEET